MLTSRWVAGDPRRFPVITVFCWFHPLLTLPFKGSSQPPAGEPLLSYCLETLRSSTWASQRNPPSPGVFIHLTPRTSSVFIHREPEISNPSHCLFQIGVPTPIPALSWLSTKWGNVKNAWHRRTCHKGLYVTSFLFPKVSSSWHYPGPPKYGTYLSFLKWVANIKG